jgi:hypothetical protein
MSDTTEEPDAASEPTPPTMIPVTIEIPDGLLAGYDGDVELGIYPSRESALLHGLVESSRHHRGRYSTLRIDLLDPADKRPDTPRDADSAADALAAAAELLDEGGEAEPDSGEGDGKPVGDPR